MHRLAVDCRLAVTATSLSNQVSDTDGTLQGAIIARPALQQPRQSRHPLRLDNLCWLAVMMKHCIEQSTGGDVMSRHSNPQNGSDTRQPLSAGFVPGGLGLDGHD